MPGTYQCSLCHGEFEASIPEMFVCYKCSGVAEENKKLREEKWLLECALKAIVRESEHGDASWITMEDIAKKALRGEEGQVMGLSERTLKTMHLAEPITCEECGAVSVNGGKLACWGCYNKLKAQLANLQKKAKAYIQITEHLRPCPGTLAELREALGKD